MVNHRRVAIAKHAIVSGLLLEHKSKIFTTHKGVKRIVHLIFAEDLTGSICRPSCILRCVHKNRSWHSFTYGARQYTQAVEQPTRRKSEILLPVRLSDYKNRMNFFKGSSMTRSGVRHYCLFVHRSRYVRVPEIDSLCAQLKKIHPSPKA